MRKKYTSLFIGIAFFLACLLGSGGISYLVAKRESNGTPVTTTSATMTSRGATAKLTASNTTPIKALVNEVTPAVVNITTNSTTLSFFGGPVEEEGAGTGMIVSSNGYILTNNHVLPVDDQGQITVTTDTGKQYNASGIGTDSAKDLALLKINATGLPTVPLGDSSQVQVGDGVVAIGNALGQYSDTFDQGIISGLNGPVTATDESGFSSEQLSGLLQTDALINPGDSGGPLIDATTGTVVGMDTAAVSDSQGIGFAIPINEAKSFITQYHV
jgi:serine protease Do